MKLRFDWDEKEEKDAIKFLKDEIHEIESKICFVSLHRNKRLSDFYLMNEIKGGHFVEIRKKSDFKKISNSDMIYLLSSKDITKEYKEAIKKSGSDLSIKLAVSEKRFRNLNDACSTYIKACKDFKKTHRFLKEIIECMALPSLIGLDYGEVKQIFMMNPRVELRKYKAKLNEKDKVIKEIKKDFKKINGCFFVIRGGVDITLDDIRDVVKKIDKISTFLVYGARVEDYLEGEIEVNLCAGWRK